MFFGLSACCNSKSIAQNFTETSHSIENQKNIVKDEISIVKLKRTQPDNLPISNKGIEEIQSIKQIVTKKFYPNHELWESLLQKYVTENGKVNYNGLKKDYGALSAYISLLSELLPNETHSKEYKLAYWINAYNAFTVDLIVRNYPVKSIKEINKPWGQRLWKLGDKWYNLDEIEHQIIRKMGEPRIHFALVCAAVSCPKLYNKAFTETNLEDVLSRLTKEFLNDPTKNNLSQNELKLSKIFSWFAKDFKQEGTIIDFLNQYSEITISSNAKKRFNDYNWELNE
jgi:hypothetical protein